MRKTEHVEILGHNLIISERCASDVIALEKFIDEHYNDNYANVEAMLTLISDSLKYNFNTCEWYEFRKKRLFKRIIRKDFLLNNLTTSEILAIQQKILELEGISGKKKVEEHQFQDK